MHEYHFAGEPIAGPGAALRRWANTGGPQGWALVYPDPWPRHPLLVESVAEVRKFLENPGTDSILELAAFDNGVLRFRGVGTLAAELMGDPVGEKACLELFAGGCRAIASALQAADARGIPSHGALSPWRLVIAPTGAVRLLGFGVPQVEALAWLDEEIETVGVDSLRFFPSERLEDRGEDGRSDLFALALIAAELATGKPLLVGTVNGVLDAIYDGKVPELLEAAIRGMQPDAVELLTSCVEHRIGDRPRDLMSLADEADALAESAAGPTLRSLAVRAGPDADEAPTDAPPMDARTEVVELPPELRAAAPEAAPTEMVNVADTLLVARGLPPSEPDTEPVPEYEPELTEIAPGATDEVPLPPPIEALADDADLPAVRQHANKAVTRAELLAALAGRAADAVGTAAGISEADRVAAEAEANKARKAASTARSSAGLMELDDEVGGARITLTLVVRAEQQAEQATLRVQGLATDILKRGRAAHAAQEAKKRAEAQAERHVEAASGAAERADAATQELQAECESGGLAHPDALTALARAWQACERADEAAGEAEAALAALRAGESHGTTLERARNAEQAAEKALVAALTAIEEAREAEREGARQVAADAASEAARARDAANSAKAAATRAREAASHVPADAEARAAATAAGTAADDADRSASESEVAAQMAASLASGPRTHAAHAAAKVSADAAVTAAGRAREAAEQVAHRAGAAAAQAARLSGLREQAATEVGKLSRVLSRQREAIAEMQAELASVSSISAREKLARAGEVCDALEQAMEAIGTQASEIDDEAGLHALVAQVARLSGDDEVRGLLGRARAYADAELEELRAEKSRANALEDARTQATEHATMCRQLVDAASERIRTQTTALAALDLTAINERCARALEILDIAEFQAGEAAQSATWANEEADPVEAQAHAETAASFATRISLDLPEADALVEEAEGIANEMRAAVEAARAAAAALASEANASLERSKAAAAAANDGAAEAAGGQVSRTQNMLAEALAEAAEAHGAVVSASQRVQSSTQPDDAEHRLDIARQAAARLAGLEANVRDRADALIRVTALALESRKAVDKAQQEARTWAQAAQDASAAARQALLDAKGALAEHRAAGEPATQALYEVVQAAQDAAAAAEDAQQALAQALATEDTDQAEAAATLTEDALERAERARELAVVASRTTLEAASTEQREREATRDRKIAAARELASTHAETAREIADRIAARRDEVNGQLAGIDAPVARAEADAAGKAAQICIDAAQAAEEARQVALDATEAAAADVAAQDARAEATRAQQAAAKAEALLERAVDHAREAAAEADALKQVVAEAEGCVERAAQAVDRAKDEAREILQLKIGLEAKKELASKCREEIQGAEKALLKVQATAPLAAGAADLGTANALLATCRATVARAAERADAVRDLVAEAARAVADEAERRAKALAEARQRGKAPAVRARDAAAQARGWLESARRTAADLPAAAPSLEALDQAAGALTALAEAGARAVAELEASDDTAAVRRTSERLVAELADVDALLSQATTARDAIEAAIETEASRVAAVRRALDQAQQIRDPAQEVASRARATVEELETWLNSGEPPGAIALEALATADRAATDARQAIEVLDALFDTPPADPTQIGAVAEAQMQRAIAGLEAVVAGDSACREAAAAHRLAHAEAVRSAEEARRKQAEEAAKAQENKALKKADDREAKRHARLEERRQRFLDRRGMSDSHSKPPVADPEPDEESSEEAQRRVRQWQRGKTQATEGTTKAKSRPRPSGRPRAPRPDAPPQQSGADALLERLRDRQNRRDDD